MKITFLLSCEVDIGSVIYILYDLYNLFVKN